jgi:hypothetical protein
MTNDLSKYEAVRDGMQTGDMLGWHSNSALGASIRLLTRKERRQYEIDSGIDLNHISGVIRIPTYETGDRRFISESLEHGPQLSLLSKRLQEFAGMVWWYHVIASDEERACWGSNALDCTAKGTPYGYWDILKYAIFGPPEIDLADGLYCSEEWLYNWGDTGKAWSPNGLPAKSSRLLKVFPVRIL